MKAVTTREGTGLCDCVCVIHKTAGTHNQEWRSPQRQNLCAVKLSVKECNAQRQRRIAEYWTEDKRREIIRKEDRVWVWPSAWSGLYVCCEQPVQSVGRWAEEVGSLHPEYPGFPPASLPLGLEATNIPRSTTGLWFVLATVCIARWHVKKLSKSLSFIKCLKTFIETTTKPVNLYQSVSVKGGGGSHSRHYDTRVTKSFTIYFLKMKFIGNVHCLLFLHANIKNTKHVHQGAHLATYMNYSCDSLC